MQNLQLYRDKKKQLKLTNQQIADLSGIPKRTIEDFFRGASANPRIDTVQAIERALGLTPTVFSDEDYANGVTDKARIEVNARQYEWLELGDEVFNIKGEAYYNTLVQMIEGIIKGK